MESLPTIQQQAEQCASAVLAAHPDWPCRRGCDLCCRRLAALPVLTSNEWRLLEDGLRLLRIDVRRRIRQRIETMAAAAPYTCPLLEAESGACLVYEQRPVACRTYGFYVERDKGLYCGLIRERVESGEFADVVWGNQELVDLRLDGLGPRAGFREWFESVGRHIL